MYKQCFILLAFAMRVNSFTIETNFKSDGDEKYLYKCCPFGHFIARQKTCHKYNGTLDFSQVEVYDKDMYSTGKSIEDVFILKSNRFENSTFKEKVINIRPMNYNIYVTESGVLQLETPNAYNRFRPIPVHDYCIDYENISGKMVRAYRVIDEAGESDNRENQEIFTQVAMCISCFFMLLVFIVYCLLKSLRNLSGLVLMSYVGSLFMAFVLLAIIQININSDIECICLTLGIYFFFLASFCWMSVMSFDIWWCVRNPLRNSVFERDQNKLSRFLKYCLYAWGVPLAMTIFLGVVNEIDLRHLPWFITPGVPKNACFLLGGVKLLYLYVPMLILNLCNWFFFIMTVLDYWCHSRRTKVLDTGAAGSLQEHRKLKSKLMLYFKLFVVMGLNWVLEIISFIYPEADILWKITDFYNILVGVSIFIIFVCKKNVLNEIKRFVGTKVRGWHSSFINNTRIKETSQTEFQCTYVPQSMTH